MYKNEIGDRGVKALAGWPGLATVEELELAFNNFKAAGAKALIASPHLTSLTLLNLGDSLLSEATKETLRTRFGKVVYL